MLLSVPELDFAILSDYVRAEGGVAHLIAGGIDTIGVPQVPAGHNVGLLIRLSVTRNECERPHRVEVIFQDEDGERIVQAVGTIEPKWNDSLPPGWKVGAMLALNMGLPLPKFGLYSIEILVNDSSVKSMDLRVVQSEPPLAES